MRRLSRSVHKRYPFADVDELESDGMLGLTRAAGRYVPMDASFRTYANRRVVGEMMDGLRRRPFWNRAQRRFTICLVDYGSSPEVDVRDGVTDPACLADVRSVPVDDVVVDLEREGTIRSLADSPRAGDMLVMVANDRDKQDAAAVLHVDPTTVSHHLAKIRSVWSYERMSARLYGWS